MNPDFVAMLSALSAAGAEYLVVYPETVLLRLIDPTSGPVVKLGASINGGGLGLSNRADGGVQILAQDTVSLVRITWSGGRVQVIRP